MLTAATCLLAAAWRWRRKRRRLPQRSGIGPTLKRHPFSGLGQKVKLTSKVTNRCQ